MDELNNLRSITTCGADTAEWMNKAIRWGVDEIDRLRAEHAELARAHRTAVELARVNARSAEAYWAERDEARYQRDRWAIEYAQMKAERDTWGEKYTNAGVEAELKIQRGWPDFRDTVAELDELREQCVVVRRDARWLLSEFGLEHWRECDDDDCYRCEAYRDMTEQYGENTKG